MRIEGTTFIIQHLHNYRQNLDSRPDNAMNLGVPDPQLSKPHFLIIWGQPSSAFSFLQVPNSQSFLRVLLICSPLFSHSLSRLPSLAPLSPLTSSIFWLWAPWSPSLCLVSSLPFCLCLHLSFLKFLIVRMLRSLSWESLLHNSFAS